MIIDILLGLLGLIVLSILLVAIKKRNLINTMITAQNEMRTARKRLEKEIYEQEYKEQLPDAMRVKVAQDLDKKLVNKKSFGEKFKELNDNLAKNQKDNNRPGLQSIMDDMNIFSYKPKQRDEHALDLLGTSNKSASGQRKQSQKKPQKQKKRRNR
tara:strand:+ start:448 stop:915 length:468 start_codon:yes stop_codon:yes gene_type:complete